MILVFVDCAQTAWYLFYGPWVAYMATEAILLGLSTHVEHKIQHWRVLTGIQILRLCILFLLVCSISSYPIRKTRRVHSDEESTPLLAAENADSDHSHSPNGYATVSGGQDELPSTVQDGKEKHKEKKQSNILEDFLVSVISEASFLDK